MKKVDMIVDLQYGSTGKGLIAGYLGVERRYDVVVNANMPNAGHTYVDQYGQTMIHKVLPSGICGTDLVCVLLGAGSVFSLEQLQKELVHLWSLNYMKGIPIYIHPNAVILQPHHAREEAGMDNIGSTKQGAGAALVEKIRRDPSMSSNLLARSHYARIAEATQGAAQVIDHHQYHNVLKAAGRILAEGAQGYSLGLNQKFWPYCTSRECTPARFMSDMGIPLNYLNEVIGTCRVHPIRVGGTSGPHYPDQTEISFESIGQVEELTTVTKKVRRLFTWSNMQMYDAVFECAPDHIFLNFCNYDPVRASKIQQEFDEVKWCGFGPRHVDVMEML